MSEPAFRLLVLSLTALVAAGAYGCGIEALIQAQVTGARLVVAVAAASVVAAAAGFFGAWVL